MKKREIPQLRRKLSLLVEHGHFSNLEAIALTVGTTLKTLGSWADSGSDGLTPGLVATKSYPKLIEVFAHAIQKHHPVQNAEPIIKGRVSDLEEYLTAGAGSSFGALVEREARTGTVSFRKRPIADFSLVKKRNCEPQSPNAILQHGEEFRLITHADHKNHNALVLQNNHQNWGFAPSHYETAAGEVWMPDPDKDGWPDYIDEAEWFGINRFIFVQTTAPFPENIMHARETGIIPDNHLLQELAAFYSAQPADQRVLSVFVLDVKEPSDQK